MQLCRFIRIDKQNLIILYDTYMYMYFFELRINQDLNTVGELKEIHLIKVAEAY